MNFPRTKSRRIAQRFTAPLCALTAFSIIAFAVIGCGDGTLTEANSKKIVILAGPPSHPSGMHEFFAGSTLLAKALNEESGLPLEVEVVQNGWPQDESVFEGADAVIIYSDGRGKHPVHGNEAKMDAMIDEGVGLMCMHYGVDVPAGEQGDYFQKWIGGYYENGFSVNPHWTAEIELDDSHPISKGVPPSPIHDEWYYNMR
ncbi:MAG: ThuA domain-containing protein, partial [Verrucomicrobiota bacterium]